MRNSKQIMQDTLDDIKGLLKNAEGDLSDADLVELATDVMNEAIKIQVNAQTPIDNEVSIFVKGYNPLNEIDELFDSIRSRDELEDIEVAKRGF
jgi:hypothetical protein